MARLYLVLAIFVYNLSYWKLSEKKSIYYCPIRLKK